MRTSLLGFFMLATTPLGAQRLTLAASAEMLHAPAGRTIATLRAGATVSTGATRSGFVEITLEGYVPTRSLGGPRDSFAVTIRDAGTDLRDAPQRTARAIASLRAGMGFAQVQRSGDWTLVRRTGWIRQSAARSAGDAPGAAAARAPAGTATTKAATPAAGARTSSDETQPATPAPRAQAAAEDAPPRFPAARVIPDSSDLIAPNGAALRDGPNGRVVATLADSARMRALFRERGWVRVRLEGWIRDADVTESDTAMRANLLPADLRADPAGTRGQLVRWEVQKLAIQTADPLQRDLALNEPYMLARGPGADHPLLYLSLPPSLLAAARNVRALDFITVIARVRNGRSSPGGVPILDVVSLVAK